MIALHLSPVIDGYTLGQLAASGETRLLFSSAQVDYARYWLHAMGFTKTVIPLPYSDCLLTTGELKSISKIDYKDGGSLRSAIKVSILERLHKSHC